MEVGIVKYTTRRLIGNHVRLVGRSVQDFSQELQEWLEKLSRQVEGGIPAGFNSLTPTTIDGVTPADAGVELEGWAAASHQHPLDISGVPADIGTTSFQGPGPGVSLSGHGHRFEITEHAVVGVGMFADQGAASPFNPTDAQNILAVELFAL